MKFYESTKILTYFIIILYLHECYEIIISGLKIYLLRRKIDNIFFIKNILKK